MSHNTPLLSVDEFLWSTNKISHQGIEHRIHLSLRPLVHTRSRVIIVGGEVNLPHQLTSTRILHPHPTHNTRRITYGRVLSHQIIVGISKHLTQQDFIRVSAQAGFRNPTTHTIIGIHPPHTRSIRRRKPRHLTRAPRILKALDQRLQRRPLRDSLSDPTQLVIGIGSLTHTSHQRAPSLHTNRLRRLRTLGTTGRPG